METQTSSFRAAVLTAREAAREKTPIEKADSLNGLPPWFVYGDPSDYDKSFFSLLHKSIYDFIAEVKSQKGKVFVFDVMGPGGFGRPHYPTVAVDGELALTLTDLRTADQREADRGRDFEIITGDILQRETWGRVRNYMNQRQEIMRGGFDLITLRPVAGWDIVCGDDTFMQTETTAAIQHIIVNRLVNLLDPEGGVLLAYLGRMTERKHTDDYGKLMYTRTEPERIKLPPLNQLCQIDFSD